MAGLGTPDWVNAISAGVDCIGFVSRAASYSTNKYKCMNNKNQNLFSEGDWYIDINYPTYGGDSDLITDYTNLNDDETSYNDLNKIKPGDIMYYTKDGVNKHITMVDYVDSSSSSITEANIHLIESTWYTLTSSGLFKFAKVRNSGTLEDYIDEEWKVVRLKIGE